MLGLFGQLHDQVRAEVEGLDEDALNWSPGADANSIATIVNHMVGSEAETLRAVAGEDLRDAMAIGELKNAFDRIFAHQDLAPATRSRAEALAALDAADVLLAELHPAIGADRLRAVVALPTLPADDRRSGLAWLVGNYGHAREHLGHIQLTKQLYVTPSATNQLARDQSGTE